jgi:ankyrin repeat protein
LAAMLAILLAGCVSKGPTPELQQHLHQAVEDDDADALRLLLAKGADPNLLNENKWSAVHLAATKRGGKCLNVLVEQGADLEAPGPGDLGPLSVAALHQRRENVTRLLESGRVESTLEEALTTATTVNGLEMIELLLQHGADPFKVDRKGNVPAGVACSFGHLAVLRRYVRDPVAPKKLTVVNGSGASALLSATFSRLLEAVQILHSAGADLAWTTKSGSTLLHYAASGGSLELVRYYIDNGLDVNARSSFRTTPLHQAANGGGADVVRVLISSGATVDAQDETGNTPLHEAARRDNLEVVEALLAAGATKNLQNKHNQTPADLADAYEVRKILD